jgi:hypothetical protein
VEQELLTLFCSTCSNPRFLVWFVLHNLQLSVLRFVNHCVSFGLMICPPLYFLPVFDLRPVITPIDIPLVLANINITELDHLNNASAITSGFIFYSLHTKMMEWLNTEYVYICLKNKLLLFLNMQFLLPSDFYTLSKRIHIFLIWPSKHIKKLKNRF